ncbi:hypothetical protein TNCV_2751711 [Trichonephila clavipes]|nr:hypothetical protein TNCV_2751711 [Trichonephila clavipes]
MGCHCLRYTVTPNMINGTMTQPCGTFVTSFSHMCHLSPLMAGLPGAIFQQENARSYTARISKDIIHHITTLSWLAGSPDLSRIEREHMGITWDGKLDSLRV